MTLHGSFPNSKRFQYLSSLGSGSSGTVYLALDHERGQPIALKIPKKTPLGNALRRFKNEFRSLQGLAHPNLVRLHELLEHEGQWFYTMEYVQGDTFIAYVRPSTDTEPSVVPERLFWSTGEKDPATIANCTSGECEGKGPLDVGRLRDALAQLAEVVHELHQRDKIHRDIKPSNILITPTGRLVLLDVGLIAAPGTVDRAGTHGYMSPEQATGQPVGPESDWYSVGVILHQALTNQLPITTKSRNRSDDSITADLHALCEGLLSRKAHSRPSGLEVLSRVGVNTLESKGAFRCGFVGRQSELNSLMAAYESVRIGGVKIAVIEGQSGVGKSRLLTRFDELLGETPLVLRGRCYEHESVPYKAFDQIIDSLSEYLSTVCPNSTRTLFDAEELLLARAFPVLQQRPASDAVHPDGLAKDPQEQRSQVFAALRRVFGLLAQTRPLVLLIDDLQWTDVDSLALLKALTQPPEAPPMLVVATSRPVFAQDSNSWRAHVRDRAVTILLTPLPHDEATDMARRLAPNSANGRILDAELIASEAGGSPYFIEELVKDFLDVASSDPPKLEDVLRRRVEQLPSFDRQLLELLAVAGEPLDRKSLGTILDSKQRELVASLDTLCVYNLARDIGTPPALRVFGHLSFQPHRHTRGRGIADGASPDHGAAPPRGVWPSFAPVDSARGGQIVMDRSL